MPWICTKLSEYNLRYPIFLFSSLSFAMAALITFLPYDTLGREIDKVNEDEEEPLLGSSSDSAAKKSSMFKNLNSSSQ